VPKHAPLRPATACGDLETSPKRKTESFRRRTCPESDGLCESDCLQLCTRRHPQHEQTHEKRTCLGDPIPPVCLDGSRIPVSLKRRCTRTRTESRQRPDKPRCRYAFTSLFRAPSPISAENFYNGVSLPSGQCRCHEMKELPAAAAAAAAKYVAV
jgi:hypothetical protein